MAKLIESCREGAVATIWLNRPDVGNAYDMSMLRQLRRALASIECDREARVVVFRGRGPHFCTGGDISMLAAEPAWQEMSFYAARTFKQIEEMRRITIAAVHGLAVGGGFELMLACDLAIATTNARIGDVHLRNGLFAGGGGSYRLPRLIGARKAKELMLSGDILDGATAKDWNIVNETAPPDAFETALAHFAARFADKSPTIAWLTKTAIDSALGGDLSTLMTLEHMTSAVVGASEDAREGVAALLEQRRPSWRPPAASLEAEFEEQGANDEDGA